MKCTVYDPSQDMPIDNGGGFGPLQGDDEIDYDDDVFYEDEINYEEGLDIDGAVPVMEPIEE